MKKNLPVAWSALLILSALILTAACVQSRERVIDNPAFDDSNTDKLQISKIVLTDTATVLYVDAYSRPDYWLRIASGAVLKGADNRVYKLLGSENFEPDAKVFMPQSGNVAFTLLFEPVSQNERSVDFVEGDSQDDFRIKNIRLYRSEPPAAAIRCRLKGEVVNRPQSSRLVLLRQGEDFRTTKATYIPVRNGKFEHALCCDHEEAYTLTFYDEYLNGAWRPIPFIAEQGEIHFTLHPADEWKSNVTTGGAANREMQAAQKLIGDKIDMLYDSLNIRIGALEKAEKYYTAEAAELTKQIEASATDDPKREELFRQYMALRDAEKCLTPEGNALKEEGNAIAKKKVDMELAYAKENTTIAGYSLLVANIQRAIEQTKSDAAPMLEIYANAYRGKYPNHPYSELVERYVNATSVKVGNPYIDVAATDAEDNEVRLSSLIAGKVALIHLWASWCGPCIRHGKEMIPVYEAYKDKGFTVVGIARERSKASMLAAVQRVKYPWVNLLELNDRHGVWTKYGIGNAGGGDFLVDDKGILLAVNTTPEEVKRILEKLLK
ncbi:MAG: redoxin domain-containing protein [Prevotellaceae bacterium]|jgi:thiol-disulfide isomerase/thioredoxin|nr:redoxin domain-containing protein [Prevotellaceae bacterium]